MEESGQAAELTGTELRLLEALEARRSIPFDELRSQLLEVRSLVERGCALLVVLQQAWGTEFVLEVAPRRLSLREHPQGSIPSGGNDISKGPRCNQET